MKNISDFIGILKVRLSLINAKIKEGKEPKLYLLYDDELVDTGAKYYMKSLENTVKKYGLNINITRLGVNEKRINTTFQHLKNVMDKLGKNQVFLLPIMPMSKKLIASIKLFINVNGISDIDNITENKKTYSTTAQAVYSTLEYLDVPICKNICIIGRNLGKDISNILTKHNYTTTILHSSTPNSLFYRCVNESDVLISVTGKENILDLKYLDLQRKRLYIDVGLRDLNNLKNKQLNIITGEKNKSIGTITTLLLLIKILVVNLFDGNIESILGVKL